MSKIKIHLHSILPHSLFILLVILVVIYFAFNQLFQYLIRELELGGLVEAQNCRQSQVHLYSQSSFFPAEVSTLDIPLKSGKQPFAFTIPASARTIRWEFCPQSEVSLSSMTFYHRGRPINISLSDSSHLLCIGCESKIASDSSILFTPNPAKVTLQIGGIHQIVSYYYQALYRLYYYLPQVIVFVLILFSIFSLLPLTLSRIEFIIYSLTWLTLLIKSYNQLPLLFPPATFGSLQIIAAAQYLAYSVKADAIIMSIFILGIVFISLGLFCRNRLLKDKPYSPWKISVLTFCLFFLIMVLMNFYLTN